MNKFLLILAIHGLLLGFAFLMAGWCTLLMAENDEEAKIKRGYEEARQRGWMEAWRWYSQFRRNFASPARLSANWRARPDARRFIYVGLGFLAVAAVLGIPLGAYD